MWRWSSLPERSLASLSKYRYSRFTPGCPPPTRRRLTGTTILLTGAMSKMGVYGFLRILLPIFGAQMQVVLTPLLVAGGGDDCPLRVCRACAERPEAHLRLLLDQSSRLLPAGNFCGVQVHRRRCGACCREVCGDEWRVAADVQSWADCGNGVLVCRACWRSAAAGCAGWTISAGCARSRLSLPG